MFANPIWSALILVALIACYALVRWKHGGPLLIGTNYTWSEWFVGFRTWVAALITGLGIALPDLAVAILPIDLSWLIGEYWAPKLTGVLTLFLAINGLSKTKPDGVKAD